MTMVGVRIIHIMGPRPIVRIISTTIMMIMILMIIRNVDAYSKGAGSCISNMAAVTMNSFHTEVYTVSSNSTNNSTQERDVTMIPYESSGIVFTINDFPIEPTIDVLPISIRTNGFYKFSILSSVPATPNTTSDADMGNTSSPYSFRGVLIRVEQGQNSSIGFVPMNDTLGEVALECMAPSVYGVTHSSAVEKTEFSSIFITESLSPSIISIDITIVFVNDYYESKYTYQQFQVGIVQEQPNNSTTDDDDDSNNTSTSMVPSASPIAENNITNATPTLVPSSSFVPSTVPSDVPSEISSNVPTLQIVQQLPTSSPHHQQQPQQIPISPTVVPSNLVIPTTITPSSSSSSSPFYNDCIVLWNVSVLLLLFNLQSFLLCTVSIV